MCLNVKKLTKKDKYKETTYKGNKGDSYEINTWQKCGACAECMAEKANNWLVRNTYEAKAHDKKCFITLTYKNNPYILIKKDLQDFIKRLRFHIKKNENIKIRYFACGEYGTLKGRPHYHIIIYGWHDPNAQFLDINKKNNIIKYSELIQKTWGKGRTAYQEFNDLEIPYIALYNSPNDTTRKTMTCKIETLKKIYENNKSATAILEKKIKKIKGDYLQIKEFNTWSKALGQKEWLKTYDNTSLTWKEYILDKEILTPSPWVKMMAESGEILAIKEMLNRKNFEKSREETTEERKQAKITKQNENHLKELIPFQTKTIIF